MLYWLVAHGRPGGWVKYHQAERSEFKTAPISKAHRLASSVQFLSSSSQMYLSIGKHTVPRSPRSTQLTLPAAYACVREGNV